MASMDKPIPETNKGHQMLLRMGWRGAGTGLGRESRGIYDPIRLKRKLLDLNSRVGLGKTEEESEMHVAATESRNALESEIQANESEDRRRRREEMVMKQEEIKVEVQEIVSIFRCDICDKQYTTDAQYQEHLNSYDHHHKKRFDDYRKEEKARQSGGTSAQERQRKEQKRMEKEMAARASAIKAAAAASASSLPNPPPSSDPPPPPPDGGGPPAAPVKFGFAAPKVPSSHPGHAPSWAFHLSPPTHRHLCAPTVLPPCVGRRVAYRLHRRAGTGLCVNCGDRRTGNILWLRALDGRVLWHSRAKRVSCLFPSGPRRGREEQARSLLSSRRLRFLAPMTTMNRTRPCRDTGRPYLSGIVLAARPRVPAAVLAERAASPQRRCYPRGRCASRP